MSSIVHRGLAFIAVVAALTLGCRRTHSEGTPDAVDTTGAFRVAIVLPGPHDDHEWSQAGFEGLELIKKELGATVAYSENVPSDGFAKAASGYAAEGFALVIGHGAEYADAAMEVANKYPRTRFALVALHPGNNRNLGAIRFREAEIGYLAGAVAALRTKSRKVAYIAGVKYHHLEEQASSFERGAKSIDPNIEVATEWLDSWTDVEKARRTARQFLDRGFDVLSINADKAGLSGIDEAKKASAYAIGWNLDQHEVAAGTVVTSGVQRMPVLLLEGARLVRLGRFEGKQYRFGLREGAQDLAPFYGLLTGQQAAIIARIREDILTGKLDVSHHEAPAQP
jgi:basic membrane protein A